MSTPRIHLLRRFDRLLSAAAIVALAAAAGPLAQVAQAGPSPPSVPDRIQVPAGNKLFLVGHAVGVQIYPCNPVAAGYAWGSSTPRADLVNDHGKQIATHFGGPTWQATDGSRVVAQRDDGVIPDLTAIAWLRLSRVSSAAGPDGDRLVATTYIQRINTVGGLAPNASECNATTVGERREVSYTADYYFWKKSGDR